MESSKSRLSVSDHADQARRTKKIIYVLMAIFILLPVLLAWITGSLSF